MAFEMLVFHQVLKLKSLHQTDGRDSSTTTIIQFLDGLFIFKLERHLGL